MGSPAVSTSHVLGPHDPKSAKGNACHLAHAFVIDERDRNVRHVQHMQYSSPDQDTHQAGGIVPLHVDEIGAFESGFWSITHLGAKVCTLRPAWYYKQCSPLMT